MNYIVMNGDMKMSSPISKEEAEKKVSEFKATNLYPNAYYVETDEEVKDKIVLTTPAENVEDVGCAGGACTL